jgi:hypothetical protein
VTFRYVNNFDIVPHVPPTQLPAPSPPVPFPHLPGSFLDLRHDVDAALDTVNTLVTGERFADLGQLRLFIGDRAISEDQADLAARDPFELEVPKDPLEALSLVRARLTLTLEGYRGFLDHDPVTGYLPRLQNQLLPEMV